MARHGRGRRPRIGTVAIIFIVGITALIGVGYYLVQLGNDCGSFPFPSIASKPVVLHEHVQLMIIVNGQNITLPVNIGHGDSGGCIQPVHTHADPGDGGPNVIHIESPTANTYTLGDFFNVWASTPNVGGSSPVTFNKNQLFNYTAGDGYEIRMYVNGIESDQYQNLALASHQTIVIVYGNSASAPWAEYQRISAEPWPFSQLPQ
ncbi:MAG: hypothetical protein HYW93_08115 [Thaumarchaeota archaeon]|nr:hypothetical protein [Nitrososphaerota archaeon]